MSCTTSAVLHEVMASGLQDATLTSATLEEAVLTFWRFVYLKHTSFAIEPITFTHNGGSVAFGQQRVRFQFPRQADLAWATFAKVSIPGIVGLDTTNGTSNFTVLSGVNQEPYWTNAIGQFIMQKTSFCVGSTEVDVLENYQLFFWEELSGKPGKRLSEMIGKFDTVAMRQAQSRRSRVLYVPLPFYFTENTGLSLPIVSLQFHAIELHCQFAARADCVVKPADFPATNADVYVRQDGLTNAEIEAATIPTALADSDLNVEIETFGVYLDHDERSKFAHGQFEQSITETQYQPVTISETVSSATETTAPKLVSTRILFNHVVMQFIMAVRRKNAETSNDWFNFGGYSDPVSESTLDPVKNICIKFNNQERVRQRPAQFFRLVVPWVVHTNIPREFIYTWSFAIEPEDAQPTGGANLSRIDNVYIDLNIDKRIFLDGSDSATLLFTARNKNLLRFKYGLLSLRFGS